MLRGKLLRSKMLSALGQDRWGSWPETGKSILLFVLSEDDLEMVKSILLFGEMPVMQTCVVGDQPQSQICWRRYDPHNRYCDA
jgi:hypothetical protein